MVQGKPAAGGGVERATYVTKLGSLDAYEKGGVELIADDPRGLGGGLWTNDLSRADRVARGLRAGMVWINSYKRVNPGSPFGGIGVSGYGREMGFEAMREYTEPKATWVNVDAEIPPFYPRG